MLRRSSARRFTRSNTVGTATEDNLNFTHRSSTQLQASARTCHKQRPRIASTKNFPSELEVTSVDEFGSIMSLQHKEYNISAVQFHPESILTPLGENIVRNFIEANKK